MNFIKFLFRKELLRDVYPHATWFQVQKFRARRSAILIGRAVVLTATIVTVGAASIFGYSIYNGNTVEVAEAQVITQVVEAPAPIMDRIADCESGNGKPGSATQTRNGQVLISINTNGTYDQGKFQINSIHNKEAASLGDNLATEEGNTAYAHYLYATKGTGDWASSQHCWAR
jgi:hypothetical protein